MNVRFLDGLGSRGGYNYIIGGMMYSTGCWNYRLSQYRRYNKEREKKQRDGKVVHAEKDSFTHVQFLWFFFERKYRSSDSWIKEKRWYDSFIQWISNHFFFYQILLLFPRTRVHLPCLTTVISIVIIYFYVR